MNIMGKMNSMNPFNDPEFKKQLLGEEGISESNKIEEPELLQTEDVSLDLKGLISGAPTLPKTAKNLIMDASALAKNQKEQKALEMSNALNSVISSYNKDYGMNIQIDFSNLSRTLVNVSDPETRKVLELYVSEIYRSMRPIMLLHLINKLVLAIDYATQPERMFDSNSFTPADTFLIVEKLMQYIDQLNVIYQTTAVKDSDQVLKKLAENKNNDVLASEESKEAVNNFLALFKKDSGIGE